MTDIEIKGSGRIAKWRVDRMIRKIERQKWGLMIPDDQFTIFGHSSGFTYTLADLKRARAAMR